MREIVLNHYLLASDENAFARRFGGRHRLGEDDDEAGEEEDDEEEEEDDDADDQHDHHRDDPYENDVPDEDDDVQPVEDESIADEAVGEDEEIDANDAMYFENHNDHADDAENIMNAEEGQDVEEENDDDEDQLEMQSMEEDDQEQNMGNLYSMYPESADDENDSTEAENALLQSLGDNSFARNRVDGSRGRTNRLEILSAQQASDHRTQAARSSARFVLHNIAQRVGHPYSNAGLNDLLYEFDLGRPSGDGASSAMINFHNMLSGDVSSGFRSSREGNSFTLTFGSNRPISAGDLSSRLGPAVRAANAPTPHPLLSIQENRRPRTGPLASFSSEIYSNLLSQGSSDFSSFGERSRGHALGFSATTPRRRSLGPIVSDRRWGTDIGELDPTGTRLNVLFEAVENAVKSDKSVEVENRDELQTKFRGKFCESYQSEDVNDESKKASSEPIVNGGSDNVVLQQTLRTDLLSSEESKDEGILQETKEDSAAVLTNPSESTVEMLRRSGEVSAFSNTPLAQITITSPANLNEVLNSPDLPVSDRVDVSDHANETSLLDSTSNGMEVASNSMDVAFTTESADSTLIQTDSTNEFANAENTAFVLSLPLFLREEVFLTADQDFLRGLPNDMRQEALQLREERAIGFQAGTYGGLSTEAEPRLEQNLENVSEVQRATESRGSNEAEDHPQNLENSTEPIEPKQEPKSELIDEGSLRILLNGDRKTDSIPFGSFIVTRLMNCFFRSGKPKWQRGFLRLLTSYCSYKIGRKWIIGALLSSVLDRDDSSSVVKMIQNIPFENSLTDNYRAIYVLEEESVTQASKEAGFSVLLLRRVIHCISYIIRKTDQLAWYDIVSAEHSSIENNLPWMFGSIISLLEANRYSSSVYLDHVIHLIEQITAPLSRLSVTEANYLVSKQLPHTTSTLETIQEEENSENDPTPTPKRQRLSSMVTGANLAKESKENDSDTSVLDNNNSKLLPFPVMSSSNARALAAAVSQSNYGGSSKKRFIRIMQNLALADCNLYLFLEQLAEAGTGLAARAFIEFTNLHNTLALLEQGSQSAAEAMALPEISTPKALYENQLLNVLKLMTSLRSQKGLKSEELSETIISDYMRKINANHLWETLCTCLDIVRDLEGIDDGNPDENNNDLMESHQQTASDVSSRSAAPDTSNFAKEDVKEDKSKVSPLIMRFMALIECFLTVCSVTILVKPSQVGTQSSNKKRKSEAPLDVASTDFVSPQRTSSTPLFMRTSSTLPGSRFRQTAEFMQMQLELGESEISQHLIEFARKNRLLLHVMLRQNVHLLETTFSPLILVPKCRQLLHFDIKRAYFKAKLRRMRQSSSRNSYNNMLRLVVRRSRVFEDSFTFMRSRTTDELRSRLSVSFHGEDGMDAGGLTREWYTVLSREIFNPDYALFTTAGDTVTFQPNPFSKVNNEHLSYFKFVGRVIGKAICDGQLLDAHFTRSFYKHILGIPVSVADLEAIEPDYYKSLKQILESSLEDLGLDLTFTAETNEFGKIEEVNLIPGGDKIVVTDENKHDYVKLIAHHRMTSAIRSQVSIA